MHTCTCTDAMANSRHSQYLQYFSTTKHTRSLSHRLNLDAVTSHDSACDRPFTPLPWSGAVASAVSVTPREYRLSHIHCTQTRTAHPSVRTKKVSTAQLGHSALMTPRRCSAPRIPGINITTTTPPCLSLLCTYIWSRTNSWWSGVAACAL